MSSNPKILYHYGSMSTLYSITTHKTLRLSSMSQSNDSQEGRLVGDAIRRLQVRAGFTDDDMEKVNDLLANLDGIIDGLAMCFSEKGDLLSQWRGYAQDASGVSIGFSTDYLYEMFDDQNGIEKPGLLKVAYGDSEHDSRLAHRLPVLERAIARLKVVNQEHKNHLIQASTAHIKKVNDAEELVSISTMAVMLAMFILKGDAFREEREWRVLNLLVQKDATEGETRCQWKVDTDKLIPFRDFSIAEGFEESIKEVYLGPKNRTPPAVLRDYLSQIGLANVKVIPSTATYR